MSSSSDYVEDLIHTNLITFSRSLFEHCVQSLGFFQCYSHFLNSYSFVPVLEMRVKSYPRTSILQTKAPVNLNILPGRRNKFSPQKIIFFINNSILGKLEFFFNYSIHQIISAEAKITALEYL